MPPIDLVTLTNWVVAGFLGLCFGVIGGYATHRFTRMRDDIHWEREKIKLEQQWKQDKEKIDLVWQQKLQELEIRFLREDQNRLRADFRRGLDNPIDTVETLIRTRMVLRKEIFETVRGRKLYWHLPEEELRKLETELDLEDIQRGLNMLEKLKEMKMAELPMGVEKMATKELQPGAKRPEYDKPEMSE